MFNVYVQFNIYKISLMVIGRTIFLNGKIINTGVF